MNTRNLPPMGLLVAGIAMVAAAVAAGEAEVSLVLIFPVVSGSGWFFGGGTLLVILSFIAWFFLLARRYQPLEVVQADRPLGAADKAPAQPKTKYGGVILIGPIPVAFGSDKNMATLMLVIGVVIAVFVVGLLLLLA